MFYFASRKKLAQLSVHRRRSSSKHKIGIQNTEHKTIQKHKIPISGRVDRASATGTVDSGSIPGRVKPKTIKIGIHSFPA